MLHINGKVLQPFKTAQCIYPYIAAVHTNAQTMTDSVQDISNKAASGGHAVEDIIEQMNSGGHEIASAAEAGSKFCSGPNNHGP